MSTSQPPSHPASPELPESLRAKLVEVVYPESKDRHHCAFLCDKIIAAITPLWPSADGRGQWTQTPPTEQNWYWHWNGDDDCAPLPMSVLYSGTTGKCFVSSGQLSIEHAIDCDQYGGWWKPMVTPLTPTQLELAAIRATSTPSPVAGLPTPERVSMGRTPDPEPLEHYKKGVRMADEAIDRLQDQLSAARAEVEAERKMRQTMETRHGEVVADLVTVRANYKNVSGHYDEAVQELVPLRAQLAARQSVPPDGSEPDDTVGTLLRMPANLHPMTRKLVKNFAAALAEKLFKAEQKYGYSDGWTTREWIDKGECAQRLMDHIQKGDPRDVAAYCAFLWWHQASTKPVPVPPEARAVEADKTASFIASHLVGNSDVSLSEGRAFCQGAISKLLEDIRPDVTSKTAHELAVFFHDTYERLAPSFGYETRKDTKKFDPTTPNGRLMIAVCEEIQRTCFPPGEGEEWALHAVHDIQNLTRLWVESDEEQKAAAIILKHAPARPTAAREDTARLDWLLTGSQYVSARVGWDGTQGAVRVMQARFASEDGSFEGYKALGDRAAIDAARSANKGKE